jgi:acyl carrier protein
MGVQADIRRYIVENILFGDGQRLGTDTPLQEGGVLDSTGFMEIIMFVEERFGIRVADSEVIPENFNTLRALSGFVERKLNIVRSLDMNPDRFACCVPGSSQDSRCAG